MRLRRDLLARAAALLAALVATVAIAACGSSASSSGGSGSTSASGTVTVVSLSRAADVTARTGGAHVALTGSFSVPGTASVQLQGEGHFNFTRHEGAFTMTLSGLPGAAAALAPGGLQLSELFKDGAVYISSPLFTGRLPGGAHWIKLDISRAAQGLGLDPSSLTSGGVDPSQYLQELRAAGASPTVVGQEDVRGVPTTRYRATVDVRKLVAANGGANNAKVQEALAKLGTSELPVEAWLDSQGRVRRIAVTVQTSAQGHPVSAHIQADYFGFGATPVVSAPAQNEVLDITGQALQGLSGLGG